MNLKLKLFLLLLALIIFIEGFRYLYNTYIHEYSPLYNLIINLLLAVVSIFLLYILATKYLNIELNNNQHSYLKKFISFILILSIMATLFYQFKNHDFLISQTHITYIDIGMYCIMSGGILFLPN